jgi:hypothetical protein
LIESNADHENSCCDRNILLKFPSNEAHQKERIKTWSAKNKKEQDMFLVAGSRTKKEPVRQPMGHPKSSKPDGNDPLQLKDKASEPILAVSHALAHRS